MTGGTKLVLETIELLSMLSRQKTKQYSGADFPGQWSADARWLANEVMWFQFQDPDDFRVLYRRAAEWLKTQVVL